MSDNHDPIGLLSAVMQYWREEQDPDLWHACQDALEQEMLNESSEEEHDELRAALVQIENWVGKPPSNMREAYLIFNYIRQACSVLDQN